jgi:hypothetical protein
VTKSLRAAHRLLKVARTLADLEQAEGIRGEHLAEGCNIRRQCSSRCHPLVRSTNGVCRTSVSRPP